MEGRHYPIEAGRGLSALPGINEAHIPMITCTGTASSCVGDGKQLQVQLRPMSRWPHRTSTHRTVALPAHLGCVL